MGKERENLPKKEEISGGNIHTNTQKLTRNISTVTDVFLTPTEKDAGDHRNTVFRISFHEFVCAFPPEIYLIFGKFFPFPFPY